MALESGTYISDLVATNPVGATDPKSQGDDHIRLIKATIKATFPNIAGAVTGTHADLNGILGLAGFTTGNFVRKSSGALEERTPAEVRADIGADNASNLASGTVADGRLSSNVPLKNGANVFTQANQFPSLELGHASDTTLARIAAGRVSVEGVELSRLSAAEIFSGTKSFTAAPNFVTAIGTAFIFGNSATTADERRWCVQCEGGDNALRIFSFSDADVAGEPILRARRSGNTVPGVDLYANNRLNLRTQNDTTAPATTGAQVRHADASLYDVGLNVMPWTTISTSTTLARTHVGKMIRSGAGSGITYTTPASTDTDMPDGAVINITVGGAGTVTLAPGSGVTLEWLNGSGAPPTGSRTLSQGAVATLARVTSSIYRVWGVGIT